MTFQRILVTALSAVAICASPAVAASPVAASPVAASPVAAAGPTVLAELRFATGARALFTRDRGTGEYALVEEGPIGRSAPLSAPAGGLLSTYLNLTPPGTAVPAALIGETDRASLGAADRAALADRPTTRSTVRSTGLSGAGQGATRRAAPKCAVPYYDASDWRDEAVVGLAAKTYDTADFAGKVRYVESYLINCTAKTQPATRTARHRLYDRPTIGDPWTLRFEGTVAPGFWQAAWRGTSNKKHRAVSYDDAWTAGGGCAVCTYAREGRFTNVAP